MKADAKLVAFGTGVLLKRLGLSRDYCSVLAERVLSQDKSTLSGSDLEARAMIDEGVEFFVRAFTDN
jgi:hypothetical protein